MSRLIDADKAKEVLTKLLYETALNNSGGASLMCEDIAENRLETWFGLVPTVDAVEVVRCKDCKKYIPCQKLPIGTSQWCDLFDRATCEMNYCGWGERKEDEIEMLPTQMSGRGER